MASPRAEAADAMAQFDLIHPPHALYRPLVHGKYNSVPLPQRHNFGTGLHTWALLGQHKLAPSEVATGLG